MNTVAIPRQTKYCQSIEKVLARKAHATNTEILAELKQSYPLISATTIHRATSRLAERGVIALAPATADGAMRYDTTTTPHDHFMCSVCGNLRDIDIKQVIIDQLQSNLNGCSISGRVTITGTCSMCAHGTAI